MSTSRSRIPAPKPTIAEIREQVRHCSLCPERVFKPDAEVEFYAQLRRNGLQDMILPKAECNEAFVRDFYTHAKHRRSMNIKFRGVQVRTFTAAHIRRFYNIPDVPECQFDKLKEDSERFPSDQIAEVLGGHWYQKEGAGQYYIGRGDMNATARNWLIFVCSNIQPSMHMTDVPPKIALLVYLLMTNQPVQVEQLIFQNLRDVAYDGRVNRSLIFPHLISDMYKGAGVPEEETDVRFTPKAPLNYERIVRAAAPQPGRVVADPVMPRPRVRRRAQNTPPRDEPEPAASVTDVLQQLLQNQARMMQDQERILQNQVHFRDELRHIRERLDSGPSPMNVGSPQATVPVNDAASGDAVQFDPDDLGPQN